MTPGGPPAGRVVSRWLWGWNATLIAIGAALVWVGPMWLGIVMLTVPLFGMAPLVLEERRRKGR